MDFQGFDLSGENRDWFDHNFLQPFSGQTPGGDLFDFNPDMFSLPPALPPKFMIDDAFSYINDPGFGRSLNDYRTMAPLPHWGLWQDRHTPQNWVFDDPQGMRGGSAFHPRLPMSSGPRMRMPTLEGNDTHPSSQDMFQQMLQEILRNLQRLQF